MTLKHVHKSVDSLNSLRKTIIKKNLIKGTEHVLLSISGGQDSICLLFLINQLSTQMDLKLGLFWCHHLWQFDSFFLMREITKISFLFQFDGCLTITPKFVPSELLARNWRHNCSSRLCFFYNYSKIILAHSANDKVETMLLNLLRGAGATGLAPLPFKSANSIANQEHLLSFSIFPMFLFSWSPLCIDLLTLQGIDAKNIQKCSQYFSPLFTPNGVQLPVLQHMYPFGVRRVFQVQGTVAQFKTFNCFQLGKATRLTPEELQVPIEKAFFPQNNRKQAIKVFINGALSGAPKGQDKSRLSPAASFNLFQLRKPKWSSTPSGYKVQSAQTQYPNNLRLYPELRSGLGVKGCSAGEDCSLRLDALQPYAVKRNTLSAFFGGIQQTNFSGQHKYSVATSQLSSVFFDLPLLGKLKGVKLTGKGQKEVAPTSINIYATTYYPKGAASREANLTLLGLQSRSQTPKRVTSFSSRCDSKGAYTPSGSASYKKNDFSDLENRKIMCLIPMFPTLPQRAFYPFRVQQVAKLSFFSIIKIPKYGKFYRKFLALKYTWKTPCIMLAPQMKTFFPITLKITLFPIFTFPKTIKHLQQICPVFLLPFLSFTAFFDESRLNKPQYASFDFLPLNPLGVTGIDHPSTPSLAKQPLTPEGYWVHALQDLDQPLFAPHSVSYSKGLVKLKPIEKKQVLWISEKLFFKKYKKISFVNTFSSNQMCKKNLSVKCYRNRILARNGKTYKRSEYTPRNEKTKKWFVFVSFTFFKACYTSLQQMQIQQYEKKKLFGTVNATTPQDTCCIDLTETSSITRYSKNINSFFFWHYRPSKSKADKLKKLPWKEKNIFFLSAYKQLKINVPQDALFVNFVKEKNL